MPALTITANGQTEYLSLDDSGTQVKIYYVEAAAGTLTPQIGKPGREIPFTVQDAPTITGSKAFIVDGPGQLSFSCTGVSGSIEVQLDSLAQ